MIPVDQTTFGEDNGNCYSACIASILELDIKDVPTFCKHSDWMHKANRFVLDHGFALIMFSPVIDEAKDIPAYSVVGGKTKRGCMHAVVYLDGEMVHDPHPDKAGIETEEDITCFVVTKTTMIKALNV